MRAVSGFQLAIESLVRLRQLRVDGDAQPTRCDCLCAGPEMPSGERLVFFADKANACVKALSVSISTSKQTALAIGTSAVATVNGNSNGN